MSKCKKEFECCGNCWMNVAGDGAVWNVLSDHCTGTLEVGKTYTNGKLSRKITKIDNNTIYYKAHTGRSNVCWITTFQDWVRKGKMVNETINYKYEVIYTENEKEYITSDNMTNIETAKIKANKFKEKVNVSNVKIIEFKTIQKIMQV